MNLAFTVSTKNRIIEFIWQHFLLLVSLYVMTLGVVLCVRSDLGSSVISSAPLAFSLAGEEGMVWNLTIGDYTNIINALFVVGQICILRSRFELVQLLQLVIGFVFGGLIDMNMYLTSSFHPEGLAMQVFTQIAGCTIMACGVAMEVRCGSVTMPGEGLPVAISKVTGWQFPKIKIFVDCALVMFAVASCYLFWGEWKWNIVGVGTLFAMFYVGFVVKVMGKRLSWFDRLLCYRPGMRRYIYGLARYIYKRRS